MAFNSLILIKLNFYFSLTHTTFLRGGGKVGFQNTWESPGSSPAATKVSASSEQGCGLMCRLADRDPGVMVGFLSEYCF